MFRAATIACAVTAVSGANLRAESEVSQLEEVVDVQQTGIFKSYPISTLVNAGYQECYSALYSAVTNTSHLNKCMGDPNAMIVVAALYGTSATTIQLGAGGMASNVFAETTSTTVANYYDSVYWYNNPTKSFGFVGGTYSIYLSPADTYSTTDTTRLSWNLDNNLGGYRAGTALNLNSDSTYRKVIYIKTDPMFRIMKDYYISDLTKQGYVTCYDAPYSDVTTQEDLAKCNADPTKKVFVGAKADSYSSKFTVGAGGIAGNVFAATTSSSVAVLRNGVYWYNTDGKSFGFAPNSKIYLEDADTYDISNTERVSWHVNGEAGGWRAGAENSLTNNNVWRKVIYVQK